MSPHRICSSCSGEEAVSHQHVSELVNPFDDFLEYSFECRGVGCEVGV
jgi:hypothetical protein